MIPAVMAIGSVITYKPLSIQPLGLAAGAGTGAGGGCGGDHGLGVAIGVVMLVSGISDATGAVDRIGSGARGSTRGSGAGGPGITGGLGGMPSAGSTGRVGTVAETIPLRSAGSAPGGTTGLLAASDR